MYNKEARIARYLTSVCMASDSGLATRACYCPECREWRKALKGQNLNAEISVTVWVNEPMEFCYCYTCLDFRKPSNANKAFSGRPSKCYKEPSRFASSIFGDALLQN